MGKGQGPFFEFWPENFEFGSGPPMRSITFVIYLSCWRESARGNSVDLDSMRVVLAGEH